MPFSRRALITPALAQWARDAVKLTPGELARRVGVSAERVLEWEQPGSEIQPTIRQARALAKACHVPFAALYLAGPPPDRVRIPHDYRRVSGSLLEDLPTSLILNIKTAQERREIAVELHRELQMRIPQFSAIASLGEHPDVVGNRIRELLSVTIDLQSTWRDPRIGFNYWRSAAETYGALVFQVKDVEFERMRGCSIAEFPLPVILVNRKDTPAGRTFTLLHEFTHLMLRAEGVCDLESNQARPPEEQRLEVYCNAVAAAALMPMEAVFAHPRIVGRAGPEWPEETIGEGARYFATSREAFVRRLLELGIASRRFYEAKRRQYAEEFGARVPRPGFVPPATDAVSVLGKTFVRTVLDAYNAERVTSSDVAEYLGVRLKHLSAISEAVESSVVE